jgi:hypothetical protein
MLDDKNICPNCSKTYEKLPNFCDNCGHQFVAIYPNTKHSKQEKYFFYILGLFSLMLASAGIFGIFSSTITFSEFLLKLGGFTVAIIILLLFAAYLAKNVQ